MKVSYDVLVSVCVTVGVSGDVVTQAALDQARRQVAEMRAVTFVDPQFGEGAVSTVHGIRFVAAEADDGEELTVPSWVHTDGPAERPADHN